jgi:hypothetical protein
VDDADGQSAESREAKGKSCFVVAPIGADGSETRKRSDQVLRHVIAPVVQAHGYSKPVRADLISESGRITQQVIQRIVEDDLVVADLTGSNPNVYYELALRHALRRPFVQIMTGNEPLPFDIADQRTIIFDHHDLDSVAAAKDELGRQVAALSGEGVEVETPLSFAVDMAALRASTNPEDRSRLEMLDMLQDLRQMTSRALAQGQMNGATVHDVGMLRSFVERVTESGRVVERDIDELISNSTSLDHDRWASVLKANMFPFLDPTRDIRSSLPPVPDDQVPF